MGKFNGITINITDSVLSKMRGTIFDDLSDQITQLDKKIIDDKTYVLMSDVQEIIEKAIEKQAILNIKRKS